jgi:hypothetical protein
LDSSRLRTGEIVAGIGGLALFVFLFFDWFSGGLEVSGNVLGGTATLSETGVSGWDALTDVPGFVIILSGLSGIALAALAASGQRVNIPVPRGAVTAYLGALAVLLILWRMFAGSPTLKIGIFLGLAAAITVTVGALMALQEDGYRVLLPVPGGRTRAAAASPPPATPAPAPVAPPPASASSGGSGSTATTTEQATTRKSPARSGGSRSGGSRSSGSKSKSTSSRSTASKSRSTASKSRASSSKGRSSSRAGAKKSSSSRSSGARKRSSGKGK